MRAPLPPDENERLAALYRYAILDTPAEPAFDRLTRTAAHVMRVPIAVISLVDKDRQFFKSCIGLDASETPRDQAFCAHAILREGPTVVLDARLDPRFADNPLVLGPPGIRFYAGVPLRTSDGFQLGTLCSIDFVAHEAPSVQELSVLQDLAEEVMEQLEFRLARRDLSTFTEALRDRSQELKEEQQRLSESELRGALAHQALVASEEMFRQLSACSPVGIFRSDPTGNTIYANPRLFEIFEMPEKEFLGRGWAKRVHPEDFASVGTAFERARESGEDVDHEHRLLMPDGRVRWVHARIALTTDTPEGPAMNVGSLIDITEQRRAAEERERLLAERTELLRELDASVRDMGRVQRAMAGSTPGACRVKVDLCFHPKHAAGGDFVCQYRLVDGRDVVLLTDVSGHELKAAFWSAHAQGKVRAMLNCGVSMDGVFERLNGFLLEQADSAAAAYELKPDKWHDVVSIAACALVFDEKRDEVLVRMYGTPSPVHIDSAGMPEVLCEKGSNPLGWFRELAGATTVRPTEGALVMLWTDGLEDAAFALGVSSLNAAFALLRSQSKGEVPGWISEAQDDVMVVCARLPSGGDGFEARWLPLLDTLLTAEQAGEIDLLQQRWKREIEFAIPRIDGAGLFDMLLCTREAVLNGLVHGCKGGGAVRLCIQYCSGKEEVRVVVCDPGPGHDFDPDSRMNDVFLDGHRGLLLMHAIATKVEVERNGATVKMNFRAMAE